jgi:hypothetical protein
MQDVKQPTGSNLPCTTEEEHHELIDATEIEFEWD